MSSKGGKVDVELTVYCTTSTRHFLSTDYYVPGCRIRKLLPGVVPTVFDEYPSYLVPSTKKPRKEPAPRCSLPAPQPSKRKVDLPELQHDFADKKNSVCTQTANKDAQRGYAHTRTAQLLTLPAKCTLQRYMGPSPTTTGMSPAMRERLVFEASLLSSKQHMATLIIDEASIKPKCIYDRKLDTVFRWRDKPSSDTPDGVRDISGILVQKLYGHQKDMTVKLARNLTKKHVYPTNLEKMNVLRIVQIFSPQVTAAIENLQDNRR
ncbi:hypothetical protein HPB50_003012 [Hyalomma asiaticum]|uniref:Uncharacterized protein n=1 Tax=Hyalomma asiaticum TaxID=266040 RepID=A0ACB7T5C8_HYAAI|nr:hypothetical protein HPB50_003012 [Hyalomma asiaticum]